MTSFLNSALSFLKAYVLPSSNISPESQMAAKKVVESLISSNSVAVFSKSYCPYCTRAKGILQSLGQSDKMGVIELDQDNQGEAIQKYLAEKAGKSRVTVPQVYIKGQLVGGCDDLQAAQSTGKLEKLLSSA